MLKHMTALGALMIMLGIMSGLITLLYDVLTVSCIGPVGAIMQILKMMIVLG